MKHIIKNLFTLFTILLVASVTISAQHQMNHSKQDSTKQMHHMMKDSTEMHRIMGDSTKMHHIKMDSTQMKQMKMQHKMDKAKVMQASESKEIWNTHCPVQEGEVDPAVPTVQYKGKTIGFCCPGCDDKFMENPEKYMEKFNEDGTLKK